MRQESISGCTYTQSPTASLCELAGNLRTPGPTPLRRLASKGFRPGLAGASRWSSPMDARRPLAVTRAARPLDEELPLWMAYQPIVSWSRGEVVAHEALLRTREHPDSCPVGLFGAARQLGIAGRLGHRVRSCVAETLGHLPGDTPVFVNIEREDLATDALLNPGDPLAPFASRIVLEITEGGARTDADGLGGHLAALRSLGYRVAIDDLGAGHNGLAAFAEDRFDIAKIDMSLVRGIRASIMKQRMVQFIYELCASQDVLCVTEGVELEEELEVLVQLGGDIFQGFLFGRPGCVEGPVGHVRAGSRSAC